MLCAAYRSAPKGCGNTNAFVAWTTTVSGLPFFAEKQEPELFWGEERSRKVFYFLRRIQKRADPKTIKSIFSMIWPVSLIIKWRDAQINASCSSVSIIIFFIYFQQNSVGVKYACATIVEIFERCSQRREPPRQLFEPTYYPLWRYFLHHQQWLREQ